MSLDDQITSKIAQRLGISQSSIEIKRQEIQGRKAANVVIHDWTVLGVEGLELIVSECINEAIIQASL